MSTGMQADTQARQQKALVISAQARFFNRNKRLLMSALMIAADVVSLVLAAVFSILIRGAFNPPLTAPAAYYALMPYLLIFLVAFLVARLYPGNGISPHEELRLTTLSISAVMILLAVFLFLTQQGMQFSRFVFLAFWVLALIFMPIHRLLWKRIGFRLGIWGEPVAIIGYGAKGVKACRFLQSDPVFGFLPLVIVTAGHATADNLQHRLTILETDFFAQNRHLLEQLGIRMAILVPDEIPAALYREMLEERTFGLKRLLLISQMNWIGGSTLTAHNLDGLLGLEVESNLLKPHHQVVKRALDLLLSAVGLVAGLPLFLVIALLIRADSHGPVIYRHTRVGRSGKAFRLWKFRTMVRDADEQHADLLRENPALRDEWESTHKHKNDPRITRVGRWLRRSSLDELPQLANIFKGEMSLVGPRPIVEEEVKAYRGGYQLYRQVRPGLTGLWQVSGRSDTSYSYRVSLDEYYIRHWSIWLDLYILLKTIWVVISRSSAY